jgi:hypothetical protein
MVIMTPPQDRISTMVCTLRKTSAGTIGRGTFPHASQDRAGGIRTVWNSNVKHPAGYLFVPIQPDEFTPVSSGCSDKKVI